MDISVLHVVAVVIISYLLGSIPTAYIIAKSKGVDIFQVGSGNMGATNVTRALGIRWGIVVMLIDVFKGVLAIYISRQIMGDNKAAATTIAALTAIIGHNWSLFATLLTGTIRGGKGAATAFGTLLVIAPWHIIVVMLVLGIVIVFITRYVSLGVLTGLLMGLGWMAIANIQDQLDYWVFVYAVILAIMLIVRFWENIQRLLAGTERRLGERV